MKNLILGLFLVAGTAVQAQSFENKVDALVDAQKFRCLPSADLAGITLKKYWMDLAPEFLGGARREEQEPLNCALLIQRYYSEGSPRLFTLLSQIEKMEEASAYAALFAGPTEFKAADTARVQKIFEGLGLKVDAPFNQLAKTLKQAESAAVWGKNVDETVLALSRFINRQNFSGDDFFRSYHYLPAESLVVAVLDLEQTTIRLKSPAGLRLEALALANHMLRAQSGRAWGWISRFDSRSNLNRSIYNPYAYLLLTGREEVLEGSNPLANGNPALNIAVALYKKDASLLMKMSRADDDAFVSLFKVALCPTLLGQIVRAEKGGYRSVLMSLFKQRGCRNLNYYSEDVSLTSDSLSFSSSYYDLLDVYPGKHAELTRELLVHIRSTSQLYRRDEQSDITSRAMEYKNMVLLRSCADAADIEALAKVSLEQLNTALESDCGKLAARWSEKIAVNEPMQAVYNFLIQLNEKKRSTLGQARVIEMLDVLEKRGFAFSADQQQQIRKQFGEQALKAVRIARRVHGEPGRDMVLSAAKDDTEETVNLSWRDMKIGLASARLSDIQLKLVDRLRQAQSEEEVQFALRDALLSKQVQVRSLRAQAKTDFEKMLAQSNRPALSLSSRLSEAKELLDKTLTAGGRPAAYNSSATSVFDIVQRGRMQCVSGTEFILLNLSMSGDLVNPRQAAVTVVRPQHVLPGIYDFSTRKLISAESTVEGAGRSELLGPALPKDTRVVLADDYLLMQILSEALTAPEQIREASFARAAKVLGLVQGEISPVGSPAPGGDSLNRTLFGFGRADIPAGDVVRGKVDVLPADIHPEAMVRYSAPRAGNESRLSRFEPVNPPKTPEGAILVPSHEYRPHRYNGPEIVPATYDPLAHLVTTAQTELLWIASRRGNARTSEIAENLERELRAFLARLPEESREALLEQVAQTDRALVDILAQDYPRGLVVSEQDSRAQQESAARNLRTIYARALLETNPYDRDAQFGRCLMREDSQLEICFALRRSFSEPPMGFVARLKTEKESDSDLILAWTLNGGKTLLTAQVSRARGTPVTTLELRSLERADGEKKR